MRDNPADFKCVNAPRSVLSVLTESDLASTPPDGASSILQNTFVVPGPQRNVACEVPCNVERQPDTGFS